MTTTHMQTSGFLTRFRSALGRLTKNRRGATTVEYIVLVAFIALGGIAAVRGVRDSIKKSADDVSGKVNTLDVGGFDTK